MLLAFRELGKVPFRHWRKTAGKRDLSKSWTEDSPPLHSFESHLVLNESVGNTDIYLRPKCGNIMSQHGRSNE